MLVPFTKGDRKHSFPQFPNVYHTLSVHVTFNKYNRKASIYPGMPG